MSAQDDRWRDGVVGQAGGDLLPQLSELIFAVAGGSHRYAV